MKNKPAAGSLSAYKNEHDADAPTTSPHGRKQCRRDRDRLSLIPIMGRRPCCSKEGVKRGPWTAQEDKLLADYIRAHGEGKWSSVSKQAGQIERDYFSNLMAILIMYIEGNTVGGLICLIECRA